MKEIYSFEVNKKVEKRLASNALVNKPALIPSES